MIIVLVGASGSGKSTIERWLHSHCKYQKIISYTTREPRENEVNGKDYWFISNEEFRTKIEQGFFAEYEEYSQNRLYGTPKEEYSSGNKVVVLTPGGLRQLKKKFCFKTNIVSFYINTNLGNRIIRYINRCGIDKFNFSDKNEIANRVERDYTMFMGIESEVNYVIDGNYEKTDMIDSVLEKIKLKEKDNENSLFS